jgi:hypothetical protein
MLCLRELPAGWHLTVAALRRPGLCLQHELVYAIGCVRPLAFEQRSAITVTVLKLRAVLTDGGACAAVSPTKEGYCYKGGHTCAASRLGLTDSESKWLC